MNTAHSDSVSIHSRRGGGHVAVCSGCSWTHADPTAELGAMENIARAHLAGRHGTAKACPLCGELARNVALHIATTHTLRKEATS